MLDPIVDLLFLYAEVKIKTDGHVPDTRTTEQKIADARASLARYGSPRQIDLALAWCATRDRSAEQGRAWGQLRNAAPYALACRLVGAVLANRDLPRHITRPHPTPSMANPSCPCAFCAQERATLAGAA